MTTYLATFHASHCCAVADIEARTPKQALKKAHELYDLSTVDLDWQNYDAYFKPLEAIAIIDSNDNPVCGWQSDELLLQQAAGDMFDALQQAVQALNTAPRFRVPSLSTDSYAIAAICDRALARAKGGAK
jgi:hypothetical protein